MRQAGYILIGVFGAIATHGQPWWMTGLASGLLALAVWFIVEAAVSQERDA